MKSFFNKSISVKSLLGFLSIILIIITIAIVSYVTYSGNTEKEKKDYWLTYSKYPLLDF